MAAPNKETEPPEAHAQASAMWLARPRPGSKDAPWLNDVVTQKTITPAMEHAIAKEGQDEHLQQEAETKAKKKQAKAKAREGKPDPLIDFSLDISYGFPGIGRQRYSLGSLTNHNAFLLSK